VATRQKRLGFGLIVLSLATGLTAGAAELGRNTAPPTINNTRSPMAAELGPATGLQLALVAPAQVFPENYAVSGLRLNLLYGRNRALRGLDLGLVNAVSGGVQGAQLGLGNLAGDLAGLQLGFYNEAAASEMGCCQIGAINFLRGDGSQGAMFGIFNLADNLSGFQLGLVNICNTLDGLQVGLINIISQSDVLIFCPIVNAQF